MAPSSEKEQPRYTCSEYREEMILAALQRSLQNPSLTAQERAQIEKEITELEKCMGL